MCFIIRDIHHLDWNGPSLMSDLSLGSLNDDLLEECLQCSHRVRI
jgi:hypothetical protein